MTRPFSPYLLAWIAASLLLLTALMMLGAYTSRERDTWVNHSIEVLQKLDAFESAAMAAELASAAEASDDNGVDAHLQSAGNALTSLIAFTRDNETQSHRARKMADLLSRAKTRHEALKAAPPMLRGRYDKPFTGSDARRLIADFRQAEQNLLSKRQREQEVADRRFWPLSAAVLTLNVFTVWLGYRSAGRWRLEKESTELAIRSLNTRLADQVSEVRRLNASLEDRVSAKTAELENTIAKLTASNAELERFTYVAAHDLQEPLRQVASFNNLLAQKYHGQLDETAHRYLGYSIEGAKRLQLMLNGLLQYTLITPASLRPTHFPASDLVQPVLADLKPVIESTSASILLRDATDTMLYGDLHQTRAVLTSLMSNSLKFAESGVAPTIALECAVSADRWQLSVTDNGIGIDERLSPRVFEMFARLHPVGRYAGAGAGLALSKKIVEYHGGSLRFAPNPEGRGTRFLVTMPLPPETGSASGE